MLQDGLTPLNPVLHSIVSFLLEFFFSLLVKYSNTQTIMGQISLNFLHVGTVSLQIQRKEVLIHNKSLNDYQCVNPVKDMNF